MGSEGKIKVGGIMANSGLATVSILSLPDRPDVAGMILHAMGKQNINIEFVVQNIDIEGNGNMTFCIDQKHLEVSLRSFRGSQTPDRGEGDFLSSQCGYDQRLRSSFQGKADDLWFNVQCPGNSRDRGLSDQHLDLQLLLCHSSRSNRGCHEGPSRNL